MTSKAMARFLEAFRTRWYRSHGPIFPFKQSPNSNSETLAMACRAPGYGNAIKQPRTLANLSLIIKTTTNRVNNA